MNHSLNALYLTLHHTALPFSVAVIFLISFCKFQVKLKQNGLHLCCFVLFRQCLKRCPRVASVNRTNVGSVLNSAERFYHTVHY